MDGIIVLSQYNQLIDEGMERGMAILRTGELQLRPVLMTCVVAGVGLLPAALSTGIGSQVQKPLAVVVVARHDAGACRDPRHPAGTDLDVFATKPPDGARHRGSPGVGGIMDLE